MLRDLKLTVRALLNRPAFSLLVISTLGLGLGATAILLAVADAILLRPLPYPDSERLVSLYEKVERHGIEERRTFSYPDFLAVRERADAFESIAVIETNSVVLEGDEGLDRLRAAWVSPAYFEVLGLQPRIGRTFDAEATSENTGENAGGEQDMAAESSTEETSVEPEVILSHRLWQTRFASREDLLGEAIKLDGESYRVIGVMPASLSETASYDAYFSVLLFGPDAFNNRHSRSFGVIARLAPDETLEQAQAQVSAVFSALEESWPDSNYGYGGEVLSMHRDATGDLRRPVALLGGAVALVLLLATFNVANMLLVESLRRRRPAAVQVALGASPWHLFRQTLTETWALAFLGAGLGLLIAAWGLPVLDRVSPVRLPAWASLEVNSWVMLTTLAVVGVLGCLLAALTAWQGTGPALDMARHGARTVSGDPGGHRVRRLLLGSQIALAFVVAVGAVLLRSSFVEWSRIDPGFSERDLVFFQASLPPGEPQEQVAARQELLRLIDAVPGAEVAALASDLPLAGGYSATVVAAEGALPRPDDAYGGGHRAYRHLVSADYFDTLGVPILRGRAFDGTEPFEGPGAAVISQKLAQRLWPGEDALGRRMRFGPPSAETDPDTLWVEVVGIAGEVRHRNLRPDPERMAEDPDFYLSLDQFPRRSLACAVKVGGNPPERLIALREAVEPLRSKMPIYAWRTLDDNLNRELRTSRFSTLMMSLFAGLALILAAVGVYGVFSHRVQERRREIGVRMALGANRSRLISWLLGDAGWVIGAGIIAGACFALMISRVLEGLLGEILYGVHAYDAGLFASVALFVSLSALLACLLPARQATRVDPQIVLREE